MLKKLKTSLFGKKMLDYLEKKNLKQKAKSIKNNNK